MRVATSSQLFVFLSLILHAADGKPVDLLPGATASEQPASKRISLVTTVIEQGSTYTLTYVPSTLTLATTLVEGTSTISVNAEAIVGALAGGAAAAALPLAIPKVVPDLGPEGDAVEGGEDGGACEKKTAELCTVKCTADWFVSSKTAQTTSSCPTPDCLNTVGCNAVDATQTNNHALATPSSVATVTISSLTGQNTATPLIYGFGQVYLAKEYKRVHIDDDGRHANQDARCEEDTRKDLLVIESVKANVVDFCKTQNGFSASPNMGILTPYDQVENRMQAVPQVLYNGLRGEGATYNRILSMNSFHKILQCGPAQEHKRGGNVTFEKGIFVVEPYTYQGKVECAAEGGKYGVAQDEALANIDDFCAHFDGQMISQGERKDQRYFQKVGGLLSTLSVAWESSPMGCEPGGLRDRGYPINKAACKRFLDQTINDCNKDQTNFKAAGINTDQCARYQLFVDSRETVICGSDPRYPEADRARWHPFDPVAAHNVIDKFCAKDLLADPAVVDNTQFSQNGDWPPGIAKGGSNGISIEVTFHSQEDLGDVCGPDTPKNQAFKTGGDDCRRRLGDMIVDGCDTDQGAQKSGGWLVESGINGCIQWQIGSIAAAGD